MQNIPLHVLSNLLFGFFAIATAMVVLFYRKNFTLYKGIAILLLSLGGAAFTKGIMDIYNADVVFKIYFLSRALIPIFLILFSEYLLKINYQIIIKLFCLVLTWILGIISFFQTKTINSTYINAIDAFLILVVFTIIIHLLISLYFQKNRLLHRYVFIFFVTLIIVLGIEILNKFTKTFFNYYISGISSIVLTHGLILIFTSAGYIFIEQKLPKIIYLVFLICILPGSLKFLYPEISTEYLAALFIICVTVFSIYYMFEEVSKNPGKIRSAILISRLLGLTLHNRDKLLEELRKWEEIQELHLVEHSQVEGISFNLNLLFQKTGRVIHKFQLSEFEKALAYNPNFISGIEIAHYYFKKFECQSIIQLSEQGDFVTMKYMPGLNPALYTNDISIMSKIIYSVVSGQKNN